MTLLNPHIAPVGREPLSKPMIYLHYMALFQINFWVHFTFGSISIPALVYSTTTGIGLPSGHSYGYDLQSSPAPSGICPAPYSGILVQYVG